MGESNRLSRTASRLRGVLFARTPHRRSHSPSRRRAGGNCTNMADYHGCDSQCTAAVGFRNPERGWCDTGCDVRCNDDDDDTPHPVYCVDKAKCLTRCEHEMRRQGSQAVSICQQGCGVSSRCIGLVGALRCVLTQSGACSSVATTDGVASSYMQQKSAFSTHTPVCIAAATNKQPSTSTMRSPPSCISQRETSLGCPTESPAWPAAGCRAPSRTTSSRQSPAGRHRPCPFASASYALRR